MRRKKDREVESVGAWEQIVQGREAESFSRGSLIYRPDQPARDLLLLIGGQVGLYLLSSEGRALTLRVMEPGQLFGQVALTEDGTYDTFAEAFSAVRLYRIDSAEVRQLID